MKKPIENVRAKVALAKLVKEVPVEKKKEEPKQIVKVEVKPVQPPFPAKVKGSGEPTYVGAKDGPIVLTVGQAASYNTLHVKNMAGRTITKLEVHVLFKAQADSQPVDWHVKEFFNESDWGMRGRYSHVIDLKPEEKKQFRLPSRKSVLGDKVTIVVSWDGGKTEIETTLKN